MKSVPSKNELQIIKNKISAAVRRSILQEFILMTISSVALIAKVMV